MCLKIAYEQHFDGKWLRLLWLRWQRCIIEDERWNLVIGDGMWMLWDEEVARRDELRNNTNKKLLLTTQTKN